MSLLLNTGAMHYRENVNDDWKPLVIKANADLTVLADEYSNASTYVVGEYCRYDGQLYRCTTAITTAENWTPAHWTETNIGDELESIKDDYLPLTAGADKSLIGNLNIYRADNSPGLVLKNGLADMSGTESATRAWFLYCQDKDGDLAGFFSVNHTATGRGSVAIAASNISNGSAVSNALELRMERDGTRSVAFTSPAAWREALGLGTSGNLPITVAQGGTGQTAIQYYNTASDLFTPASGFTVLSVAGALWGKVLSINIAVRKTTAVTTASDFSAGTVVVGKRPRVTSNIGISGGNITTGNIDGNGNVNLHGTITANGNLYIFGTYVIQ